LRAAFCTVGHVREHVRDVLSGVSRPWGAVYPIASLLRSPRSVHPVLAATRGLGWRARWVKLRDFRGQVHGREYLLGDRIRYLDRNSAAFGEIADRHFSRIRSSLGDRARVLKSRRAAGMDL
jgi:hypothetical protein